MAVVSDHDRTLIESAQALAQATKALTGRRCPRCDVYVEGDKIALPGGCHAGCPLNETEEQLQ